MKKFGGPIETFYRRHWYRLSLATLDWTYYGSRAGGTLKVKLQKTSGGWICTVNRNTGGTNYVVTIRQRPMQVASHALFSAMLWVEQHFGRPAAVSQSARVVHIADYKAKQGAQDVLQR